MNIISKSEARKILEATIRQRTLKKFAPQLASADAEETRKLMLQIDEKVKGEMKKTADSFPEGPIIH